jgi:hypothetical protein
MLPDAMAKLHVAIVGALLGGLSAINVLQSTDRLGANPRARARKSTNLWRRAFTEQARWRRRGATAANHRSVVEAHTSYL